MTDGPKLKHPGRTYSYYCADCGLLTGLSMQEITDHWHSHHQPKEVTDNESGS